ncbi:HRDC domain protein (plasmid) [Prosthecochloris aestuarii DSM 271]|uniref:HRDC domain protein n=1 Tax=Prosthecochloris aestuarii (strain DSM 271 / SK 413) TaxID=290512 RepID=B4S9Q2_PROA2|nr:HRDC domain-containing protein [Prosthecochloris aestuarii]ACF47379.1 HRDC domain protein [Prosthecochloris aestuarii DSM 271]
MLIRIVTLRFSAALDGFDDSPLAEFIKDKSVLSLREHFFIRNETPYLAVVVIFEPVLEMLSPKAGTPRRRDESWRALLGDADMPLFDSLRSWRGERCKKEGIPPYVICNNKELAKITAARPQSLSGLMQIEGFGKAKAEKYGEEILAILKHDDGIPTDR